MKDLVSELDDEEILIAEHAMQNISPDDAKYRNASEALTPYLSDEAERRTCAFIQYILLETRMEFGKAEQSHVDEVNEALKKISPLNISLLEDQVTRHDQLAVIEEIGRFVSEETKSLLHPGTTSYDILDTTRSYLLRNAWNEIMRHQVCKAIWQLAHMASTMLDEQDYLQVGRTHLQDTSPVPFSATLAGYSARLAERVEKCDRAFSDLRGKISGIVGTGASIDMVLGEGQAEKFELAVLDKLNLKPDQTATQIVQKERLADVGHSLTTLMHVLADFTNDMRMLYSSAIGEVTSRDNAERLGGSSADATKNNPINYENLTGKSSVVESGMRVLYEMIHSDFQRDLRGSVTARYQPQAMMAQVYEAFSRANKVLLQLSINEDAMAENLTKVRNNPGEAMVAILRGAQWVHPEYGVGHDFVKVIGKKAKQKNRSLMSIAREDDEFVKLYDTLPQNQQEILEGKLELYVGFTSDRARNNIDYALRVTGGKNEH